MGWWYNGVHVRLLVLVVLTYRGSVWVGDVVSVGWLCSGLHVRLLVLVVLPY